MIVSVATNVGPRNRTRTSLLLSADEAMMAVENPEHLQQSSDGSQLSFKTEYAVEMVSCGLSRREGGVHEFEES